MGSRSDGQGPRPDEFVAAIQGLSGEQRNDLQAAIASGNRLTGFYPLASIMPVTQVVETLTMEVPSASEFHAASRFLDADSLLGDIDLDLSDQQRQTLEDVASRRGPRSGMERHWEEQVRAATEMLRAELRQEAGPLPLRRSSTFPSAAPSAHHPPPSTEEVRRASALDPFAASVMRGLNLRQQPLEPARPLQEYDREASSAFFGAYTKTLAEEARQHRESERFRAEAAARRQEEQRQRNQARNGFSSGVSEPRNSSPLKASMTPHNSSVLWNSPGSSGGAYSPQKTAGAWTTPGESPGPLQLQLVGSSVNGLRNAMFPPLHDPSSPTGLKRKGTEDGGSPSKKVQSQPFTLDPSKLMFVSPTMLQQPTKQPSPSQMPSQSFDRMLVDNSYGPSPLSTPSAAHYLKTSSESAGMGSPLYSDKGKAREMGAFTSPPASDDEMYDDDLDAEGDDDVEFLGGRFETRSRSGSVVSRGSRSGRASSVSRSGTGKTRVHKGDTKPAIIRLRDLLEDLFEADDTLPDVDSINAEDGDVMGPPCDAFFFIPPSWRLQLGEAVIASGDRQPILRPGTVRKLLKLINLTSSDAGKASNANANANANANDDPMKATPERLAELDPQELSRLLRILERGLKAGEDLELFEAVRSLSKTKARSKSRVRGAGKQQRRHRGSSTPGPDQDAEFDGLGDDGSAAEETKINTNWGAKTDVHLGDEDLEMLGKALNAAADSVLAAECCLALLAADQLPKQLYSEDLISSCFSVVKNHLSKIVYPFVEACADFTEAERSNPFLFQLASRMATETSAKSSLSRVAIPLSRLFQILCSALARIQRFNRTSLIPLSEAITVTAVYVSVGPFFVVEPAVTGESSKAGGKKAMKVFGGQSALKGLRMTALALLRDIFARHVGQRQWILEEILSSLTKIDMKKQRRQFRLRDGKVIHTTSALLIQLVQTCAQGIYDTGRAIETDVDGTEMSKEDRMHVLWQESLDSARDCSKTIAVFLIQRAASSKAAKSSLDGDYRMVLDSFVSDLLSILFLPEWPAASLLLNVLCKAFMASLDESKGNDTGTGKAIAIEHLGSIGARLRQSAIKRATSGIRPLSSAVEQCNVQDLDQLCAAHNEIFAYLSKSASDDAACEIAARFMSCSWGIELRQVEDHATAQLNMATEDEANGDNLEKKRSMLQLLRGALYLLSSGSNLARDNVFDMRGEDEHVDVLSEQIAFAMGSMAAFDLVLRMISTALESSAVQLRTKALRALGLIVTADPDVLSLTAVRSSIEGRVQDPSTAVRDAAIELIGKHMLQKPELVPAYYELISKRIADTGLAVRKRVVRLLRSIYSLTDSKKIKTDACRQIVLSIRDEDDGVQDLAVKTIDEMWFGPDSDHAVDLFNGAATTSKTHLVETSSVLLGVVSAIGERNSVVEELLGKIIASKKGDDAERINSQLQGLCDCLLESLIDEGDAGYRPVNCIRTVHVLASTKPSLISTSVATRLLPYLKGATTAEERAISELLLKIFRATIPRMPKTALKFSEDLQKTLLPMISKSSSATSELVGCFSAVVNHQTHDYRTLIHVLKQCVGRLRVEVAKFADSKQAGPANLRQLQVLLNLVALLCEHSDFDRIRSKLREERAAGLEELDSICKTSITEYIYDIFITLYHSHPVAKIPSLHCLGCLYRAYPTLMTDERSTAIMDEVFSSEKAEGKQRLLQIMQSFLVSESSKKTLQEQKTTGKAVDMKELIGNTEGFADSGVSSAVVQRYLHHILAAAETAQPAIQRPAVDILNFTVKQGLAHPIQCLPTLIALETGNDKAIAAKAFSLHAAMHSKHASIINSRFLECARVVYNYQARLCGGENVKGFRGEANEALFRGWFSLVKEKRKDKLDFLKSLVKCFNVEAGSTKISTEDIRFVRFITENLSAFDYKTLEEPLTVIHALTKVLSVAGMQTLHSLTADGVSDTSMPMGVPMDSGSEYNLEAALDATSLASQPPIAHSASAHSSDDLGSLARTSVIIGLALLLKDHLKAVFGLPEAKCAKFVPDKKSALGDRPAVKRVAADGPPLILSYEKMPFANREMRTEEDFISQKEAYVSLVSADGTLIEHDDLDDF